MPMQNVTLTEFLTYNRRARKPALRKYLRKWKNDHQESAPAIIYKNETRDEILYEARRIIEDLQWKRKTEHQARIYKNERDRRLEHREQHQKLNDVARRRLESLRHPRIDPQNRAFYVGIVNGNDMGLLYGPVATQMAALRAKPFIRNLARDLNCGQSAFASFGTLSIPIEDAKSGILNHHVPHHIRNVLRTFNSLPMTFSKNNKTLSITEFHTVNSTSKQLVLL
jgi:hypothetical protein